MLYCLCTGLLFCFYRIFFEIGLHPPQRIKLVSICCITRSPISLWPNDTRYDALSIASRMHSIFFFLQNTVPVQMFTYTHTHIPLWIHLYNLSLWVLSRDYAAYRSLRLTKSLHISLSTGTNLKLSFRNIALLLNSWLAAKLLYFLDSSIFTCHCFS